jgi:hypothetical protein
VFSVRSGLAPQTGREKVTSIIVWSNLTADAWDELQRTGQLRASRRHIDVDCPSLSRPNRLRLLVHPKQRNR